MTLMLPLLIFLLGLPRQGLDTILFMSELHIGNCDESIRVQVLHLPLLNR